MRWGLLNETEIEEAVSPEPAQKEPYKMQSASALDLAAVKKQMGALDEGTLDMLRMFIEMTQPSIEKIKVLHGDKNYSKLTEEAHSLKGAARSACCTRLGGLAEYLQNQSEARIYDTNLISEIEAEFKRAEREIMALRLS